MNGSGNATYPSFIVGLTGGIGSGKSTVADMFQTLGATVIDSDAVSHRLTAAGGAAIAAIRDAFGADFIDESGALDRTRMRQLAFGASSARLRLESILHPMIRNEMWARASSAPPPYCLLVVPLLFETAGYAELPGRILVVDCPEQTQLARTMQRSGLNESTVRSIMAQQLDREARLARADDVIVNDGALAALRPQVERLHQQYLDAAARKI